MNNGYEMSLIGQRIGDALIAFIRRCVVMMIVLVPTVQAADGSDLPAPHQRVQTVTQDVIALLNTGIDPVNASNKFIAELSAVLDPIVAFDYIARGVMGVHSEQATPEQQQASSLAFKRGLVNTYGKGIGGFRDLTITVLPPLEPIGDERRTIVVQEVRSQSNVVKIAYTMAKNRQNEWKMINLVLNGINFGQTFRGQFAAAVQKNNGDLDKTIQQWEQGVQ